MRKLNPANNLTYYFSPQLSRPFNFENSQTKSVVMEQKQEQTDQ